MMMYKFLLGTLVLMMTTPKILLADSPTYLVMVSEVMRPGYDFDVSIHIFSTNDDVDVVIQMRGSDSNNRLLRKTATFATQTIVTFKIPSILEEDNYKLIVSGSGGETFTNETTIEVKRESFIIVIQTDKPIYQPGQTINYRVFAVDSRNKPYLGFFWIILRDAAGNKIEELERVKGKFGVYVGELKLGDNPVEGDWNIEAETKSGEKEEVTVLVEAFKLPKAETKVTPPSFFHESMVTLTVTIETKYTFGQPVKGTADVSIGIYYPYSTNDEAYPKILREDIQLNDGVAQVSYSLDDISMLYKCTFSWCRQPALGDITYIEGNTLRVTANVTDEVSGEVYSGHAEVMVERYLHKLEYFNAPDTFKSGRTYTGFVRVTLQDGTPPLSSHIDGSDEKLKVQYSCAITEPGSLEVINVPDINKEFTIPSSGIVNLSFDPPPNVTECDIRSTFLSDGDVIDEYMTIEKFVSESDENLQISLPNLNGVIMPGDNLLVELLTSHGASKYYYQLLSKGRIVVQGSVTGSNTFSIMFTEELSQQSSPIARLIAWYVAANGEMIIDSVELNVEGLFSHKVDASFSEEEVSPGESVTFNVEADPNSMVFMSCIDMSVALMGEQNDVNEALINDKMHLFDQGSSDFGYYPRPFGPIDKKRRKKRSIIYPWWPMPSAGKDAQEILDNVHVIVLTDVLLYKHEDDLVVWTEVKAIDAPDTLQEPIRVRKLFPETWFFQQKATNNNGKARIKVDVPDTITSWVATTFGMNKQSGLGIADTAKLTVFKPFFVQIDLPPTAVRGEILELKVLVFNYLSMAKNVTVTLKKSADGGFNAASNKKLNKAQQIVKTLEVPAGDGKQVLFFIKPVALGALPIEVKGQTNDAADALIRFLTVVAEGNPRSYQHSEYITLPPDYSSVFTRMLPPNVVEGSERVVFTAIGDIMGPSFQNLDRLIRIPSGCGEQNMLTFAPLIFARRYQEATGQANAENRAKTTEFMKKGYINQLRYHRFDGSFAAFGDNSKAGSTWLTAFVIKTMESAKPYITIDQYVLDKGLQFILRHQQRDGAFVEPENGRTIHTEMQGGASAGKALTAYVAIALLELLPDISDTTVKADVTTAIDKTLNHLSRHLNSLRNDPYALALIHHALLLDNHTDASTALTYLEDLATNEEGMRYWKRDQTDEERDDYIFFWRPPYPRPPANAIEMTSYVLLSYLKKNDIGSAALVVRWLSAQRSITGGYSSTQDTVLGLEALTEFSMVASGGGQQNMDISITGGSYSHDFTKITSANMDIYQQIEVEASVESWTVSATGSGVALVQMTVYYNEKTSRDERGYSLSIYAVGEDKRFEARFCAKYRLKNKPSGMAVVQVNSLSGYVPNIDRIMDQHRDIDLAKVEMSGNTLALYFNQITSKSACVTVPYVQRQVVENIQATWAKVFSYYSDEETVKLYKLVKCKQSSSYKTNVCVKGNCITGTCEEIVAAGKKYKKRLCKGKKKKKCCASCK